MTRRHRLMALHVFVAAPIAAAAQAPTLAELQDRAIQKDARIRQLDILGTQSSLRLRNLAAENLPAVSLNAQTQYQSTVTTIPLTLPGVGIPKPPHDTYDASVLVRQRLFDPSQRERRQVELAELDQSRARVRSAVYGLRQNVSDAYFNLLDLLSQKRQIETVITDLEAQHRVVVLRLNEGAALPSEARILEAEMIRRRQTVMQLDVSIAASREILRDLTGETLSSGEALPLPDDSAAVHSARTGLALVRNRPEFTQFAAQKEVLARHRHAINARELPRVSAFARGGYGRPGLNALSTDFDTYWLGGIQLEWNPWSWGSTSRERQILALQQDVVNTEETAFASAIERAVIRDLADVDRLEASLADDRRIVEIRESVLRETRARLREGVITSAEYVDRQTDVLVARLALSTRQIELAAARARFLTTLGIGAQ
jgi:outer membrane protein TolC